MIKDILFVFMVLTMTVYAHTNKNKIINFIEFNEEVDEGLLQKSQCPIIYTDLSTYRFNL